MAHILLSKKENDFLREVLLSYVRFYKNENNTLQTFIDESPVSTKSIYNDLLNENIRRISDASLLYTKLLDIR